MKRMLTGCLLGLLALQSCNSASPPPPLVVNEPTSPTVTPTNGAELPESKPEDRVIARIGDQDITLGELLPALMENRGLDIFLQTAQRDLAAKKAADLHIIVTPKDIADEHTLTMIELKENARQMDPTGQAITRDTDDVTPEEAQELLQQTLTRTHVTMAEFDLSLETNAYLRKIVTPVVNTRITDDAVRAKFNSEFGEKAITQYIVLHDAPGARDAMSDLRAGKTFDEVVQERSVDPVSRANGGHAPPFSRVDNISQEIKDATFALQVGEVSDPVDTGNYVYLIKLLALIPPQHANYDDYKDSVRHDLVIEATTAAINAERRALMQEMLDSSLSIADPVLRQQWDDRFNKKPAAAQDEATARKKLADDLARQRAAAATQPLGMPAATQSEFEPKSDAGGATPTANPAAPASPTAPAPTPAGSAPQ